MKIKTKHTEIGYTNNVAIVEKALREQVGFDDNSHVILAVAAHVWSQICFQGSDEKEWSEEHIKCALNQCEWRVQAMKQHLLEVTRPRPAKSPAGTVEAIWAATNLM
jgi:hypothetical protein